MKKTLQDSAAMRWLMLVLISCLMFSTYWFYDFFSGIKGLMNSELGISSEEFGRIIASTTLANVFGMIIIGGIVLDKWGIRIAGSVFGGLAFLGAGISAFALMGVFGEDKSTMLLWAMIGRIIFGSGLEVVCVVVSRAVIKWFKGYELALALAVNMGIGRLGTALGISLSPDIADGAVSPAVSFAAILVGLSLILFLVYIVFDIKLDRQIKANFIASGEKAEDEEFRFSDLYKLITNKSFVYITLLCVAFYSAVFPFIQYAPDLLVNKFGFSYDLPKEGDLVLMGSSSLGIVFIYLSLFAFGLGFSMIPTKIRSLSGKITSVVIIASLFALFVFSLRDIFSIWLVNGPKTTSLIPMGTILFTPIFGSYVDRKGKAASLMILGSFLLIFAHISLSILNNVIFGYLGLVSLGIAFSLVPAAMWPSVARIVAENRLGTAYATMFTIQNWGLMSFFWGIGAFLDLVNKDNLDKIVAGEMPYDYTWPILVLVFVGVISIFLALQLKKADKQQGYGLELPSVKK